ncbi:hypothetical protein Hypma_008471 [Hypsizygus marmoreus]|uniref:Uncharacterized protein n=1 Tax=Hypsizygus marmoreus TaxID=39966 RepID=A0A369JSW3_HYPMA|nr:hypothetical protein Hypma_008471 [Hypsizygus marmoreus]
MITYATAFSDQVLSFPFTMLFATSSLQDSSRHQPASLVFRSGILFLLLLYVSTALTFLYQSRLQEGHERCASLSSVTASFVVDCNFSVSAESDSSLTSHNFLQYPFFTLVPYAACRGRHVCTVEELGRVFTVSEDLNGPYVQLASGSARYWVHHRRTRSRPLAKDAMPAETHRRQSSQTIASNQPQTPCAVVLYLQCQLHQQHVSRTHTGAVLRLRNNDRVKAGTDVCNERVSTRGKWALLASEAGPSSIDSD